MTKSKNSSKPESALQYERREHLKTKIKLAAKEREIHEITQSSSYRLAKKIALSKHVAKKAKNALADVAPNRAYTKVKNKRYVLNGYSSQEFLGSFEQEKTSELAVILHLYYPELAEYYASKLERLQGLSYDLFVTIPDTKRDQVEVVRAIFPESRISIVPNGGRDVLPFVETARQLKKLGYKSTLKLHSKKSPHRSDGEQWRDRIVDSLLPTNSGVLKELLKTLNQTDTAIVGPTDEYMSMLVNYSSTSHHVKRIVTDLLGKKAGRELASHADEFGFYAGTMFWVRLDSLDSILGTIEITDFEPEMGQVDSTMAHALERLFCVIPELEGRSLYEISNAGVQAIEYHTTNIPEWSDVYVEQ